MRTLVTGAAGFIGSTLVDRLLDDGHDVVAVDDLSTGRLSNLAGARRWNLERPGTFSFATADITDPGFIHVVRRARPEVVFHLAAQIDVRRSVTDPLSDATVNVLGTVCTLQGAVAAGARKVVLASSGGAIYGEPRRLPVTERAGLAPLSPYGAAKASAEIYCISFAALHGLAWTSLALANVYGPRQDPRGEAGVVAVFGSALLAGERATIFGDGSATRDYVYVEDVVEAFVCAARRGDGRRFNIGTGVETSARDLHALVATAVGAPDRPAFAAPRPGELRRSALDAREARDGLGWQPITPLAEGLDLTVAWLRGLGRPAG